MGSATKRLRPPQFRRRSVHSGGSTDVTSRTIDERPVSTLFVESTRTRTLTTSRRSIVGNATTLVGNGNCTATHVEMKRGVLVNCRKGQPAFVHMVTAEALPESGIPEAMGRFTDETEVGVRSPASVVYGSVDVSTTKDAVPEDNPKVGRTESVTSHRRGRSLFRSKEHKRSRARSPGLRRDFECRESVAGGTVHSGMNSGYATWTAIRRESLSPRPANRKRTWRRKVMSRVERERRLAIRKNEGGIVECEGRAAVAGTNVELERNEVLDSNGDSGFYEGGSSGRLATWS